MGLSNLRNPEVGPIITPSEHSSLPLRINRSCSWNQCLFCPVYKGEIFSQRTVKEIKRDIDFWAAQEENPFKNVFLQDADPLRTKTSDLLEIIEYLKDKLPETERITCYARASTLMVKTPQELQALHDAGLAAVYVGLESGYDKLLRYMKKGLTPNVAINFGLKVKEAGIKLNFFVLLGLSGKLQIDGKDGWKQHAMETANVLNEVDPDYIRFRTLYIQFPKVPLLEYKNKGEFEESGGSTVLQEQRLLMQNLECSSSVECNFVSNYLNFEGKLPQDKNKILKNIDQTLEESSFITRRNTLKHL